MKLFIRKNWLFISILIIQLFVLIYTFAFFKQGFHSDELYEYGFANSYDLRVLEMDNNGVGLDRQWTDSKELLEYISVDKDHRFSYSNIFKHASMDYYNPPLKLFLLHTICSFFPGIFSKWFSFIINIFSFIVIQVFLYLLIKKMTKSIPASIACICLFGFGAGCFNAMMFLRMYAMGMALGTTFLYFSYLFLICEEKKKKCIYLIAIFLSLFAGAYTLHLFLVYAFPIVLILCIFYLILLKIEKMFSYGFTCLGSVILSFLAFPKTIGDTMQSTESYTYSAIKYSDLMQLRLYTFLATIENFGIHTDMYSNIWMKNIIAVILFIVVISIPLFVLFRKEEWFRKFLKKYKDRFICWIKSNYINFIFMFACLSSIIFVIYIAAIRTSIYIMTVRYASRYIYMIYPLLSILATLLIYYILVLITSKKRIISLIIVSIAFTLSTISQIYNNQYNLFLHNEKGISLKKIEEDANCYLLLKSNWTIVDFTNELSNTNSYYFVSLDDYENEIDCFDNIDKDKPLYFLLDCSYVITDEVEKLMENPDSLFKNVYSEHMIYEEEIINHYESLSGVDKLELVGEDNVFERPIKIYKIIFN